MADTSQLPLKEKLWIMMRSSMIGVLATASDLTTLFSLMWLFGLDEKIANIPSLIPGLIVMFFGNKYFAFEDHSRHVVKQGARFLYVETWAFIINILLFHILVTEGGFRHETHPVYPYLARMIGTAITYFTFSFPFWTFIFHKTTVQEADFEKIFEKMHQEVASTFSGLHLPVPQPDGVANLNGTATEAAPKAAES